MSRLFKQIIILLGVFVFCSCVDTPSKEHLYKKHSGIYFDHGSWTGAHYTDKEGNTLLYRSVSTTITNDSTIPLQLSLHLAKQYQCSDSLNEGMLKLILLPKTFSAEKQFDSGISNDLKTFLDSEMDKTSQLNEIIKPKEEFTVTIGILNYAKHHEPVQMALVCGKHKPHFVDQDHIITETLLKHQPLEVSVVLNYQNIKNEDGMCPYLIIPCGKLSFIKI